VRGLYAAHMGVEVERGREGKILFLEAFVCGSHFGNCRDYNTEYIIAILLNLAKNSHKPQSLLGAESH
jgi:hypothetical protein